MANDNDHFQRARLGRGQKHARKIASQHLQDLTSRQEHGTQDLPHKTLDKKKKSTSLPFLRRHRDRFKRREQGPRKETLLSPPPFIVRLLAWGVAVYVHLALFGSLQAR
jgi:hypothetical protein